jgi:hypothetical protein
MARLLGRVWLPLVIVAVVAVAGFSVDRIRTFFGAPSTTTAAGGSSGITPFSPKVVTYEIFGPPGTVAGINYLDLNAQPQQVASATLPWSLTLSTTAPSAFANIVAQGDSGTIGCRIIVDGKLKAENTSTEVNAQTFCLVKSA